MIIFLGITGTILTILGVTSFIYRIHNNKTGKSNLDEYLEKHI